MPEDKYKDNNTDNDKKISGEEVDSIIGSLDLEALSRQYGVDPTDESTAPQPENGDFEGDEVELSSEPLPDSKLKTKLSDIFGTLLLLFSLVVFGIPRVVGKAKRQFSAILCLLLSLVIILCSANIGGSYLNAKAAAEQTKVTAQETLEIAALAKPLLPDNISALQPVSQTMAFPEGMLDKYRTAYSINPDVAGRIRIPNTSIDTLLLQDGSNTHYLRYNFYDRYTEFGNTFIDYRNNLKLLNQNTIVYGHSTQFTKLQAFYDLYKYMDYDFYINNPVIEFGTLYKDYRWKIFAIYISGVDSKDDNGHFFYYIHTEIDKPNFPGYLDQIKQRSRFFTDIGVTDDDKILTLSTCVYDDKIGSTPIDSRLIVVAKLMHDDESSEIDPLKVTDNPDYRRPQVWYDHRGRKNPYSKSENWKQ